MVAFVDVREDGRNLYFALRRLLEDTTGDRREALDLAMAAIKHHEELIFFDKIPLRDKR